MIILKIANYADCLVGIMMMNILRPILTEKMVVFIEKQLLKNGTKSRKKKNNFWKILIGDRRK